MRAATSPYPPAPAGPGPAGKSESAALAPHQAINAMKPMQVCVVLDVEADEVDADRLKALGICKGRRIQLVKSGDPLILRVLGTRVGMSARLAAGISVEPCSRCESNP